MGRHLIISAAAALSLLTWACALDFNDAVPCSNDDECPTGFHCDAAIAQCTEGEGTAQNNTPDIVESDVVEDVENDPGVTDVALDTTTTDAAETADDLAVEELDGTASTDSTACTPSTETCNGLDDNCDGEADEGGVCPSCPISGMILVATPSAPPFCIDPYEARRTDATSGSQGEANNAPLSVVGVRPWTNIEAGAAQASCQAAGKRLCTSSEWRAACESAEERTYPYGDEYSTTNCNGLEAQLPPTVEATGTRFNCRTLDGVVDMSGNVMEWTESADALGGSFNTPQAGLSCSAPAPAGITAAADVGFRCCLSVESSGGEDMGVGGADGGL
ncbi:MAG: SUMF1/EgtB/PvdO family nonheme iron enzyme [Myxococcales bacterium]|nr:SUMF1/EgtB/PvdO family nonheme iron enzyme [Myxococcales bacterium]